LLEKLSFTTLSVLDTLAFAGPMRLTDLTRDRADQPARHHSAGHPAGARWAGRAPPRSERRTRRPRSHHRGRPADRPVAPRRPGTPPGTAHRPADGRQRQAIANALPALTRLAELGRGEP
jgi:hypothetical protein